MYKNRANSALMCQNYLRNLSNMIIEFNQCMFSIAGPRQKAYNQPGQSIQNKQPLPEGCPQCHRSHHLTYTVVIESRCYIL
jgi:hypothetical protein